MWILLLIMVLVVLALMFGGFQKGTKSNGQARFGTSYSAQSFTGAQSFRG